MKLGIDSQPPVGRNFAMAYARSTATPKPTSPVQSRAWEDLRKEARKLESELDSRVAAYGKLCSGFDSSYASKGESGLAAEQLTQSKAAEIEDLLGQLSDVNDSMSSCLSGTSDTRSHTLARHRDILHDFTQEFRRLSAALGAARDRAELFGGESTSLLGTQGQGSAALLLRERGTIHNANVALDEVLNNATGVSGALGEQRKALDSMGNKLTNVMSRFPAVNGLLNAIRRKKSKDTIVIASVIAVCSLLILIYWWNK